VPFKQHASYAARFRYEVPASGCTVRHRDVFENFRDIYEYPMTKFCSSRLFKIKINQIIHSDKRILYLL
jgi:hypothetical protein